VECGSDHFVFRRHIINNSMYLYILDRLNRREECINSCPVKKGFVTNPIETRLRVGCFLCKWFVQVKTMAWGVVIVGLQVSYQSPHSDRGYQFSLKMDKPVWIVWLFCTNRPFFQGVAMKWYFCHLDLQRVCWITLWPTRENSPIVLIFSMLVSSTFLYWHDTLVVE